MSRCDTAVPPHHRRRIAFLSISALANIRIIGPGNARRDTAVDEHRASVDMAATAFQRAYRPEYPGKWQRQAVPASPGTGDTPPLKFDGLKFNASLPEKPHPDRLFEQMQVVASAFDTRRPAARTTNAAILRIADCDPNLCSSMSHRSAIVTTRHLQIDL